MPEAIEFMTQVCRNPECMADLEDPEDLAQELTRIALRGQGDAFALMIDAGVSLKGYCSQECWIATEPETWPGTTTSTGGSEDADQH